MSNQFQRISKQLFKNFCAVEDEDTANSAKILATGLKSEPAQFCWNETNSKCLWKFQYRKLWNVAAWKACYLKEVACRDVKQIVLSQDYVWWSLNLQVAFSSNECNVLLCDLLVSSIKKTVCSTLGNVQSLFFYLFIHSFFLSFVHTFTFHESLLG